LRTLAYVEHRLPGEVSGDITFGGADTVAVRLTPDAPPGEAPLHLASSAIMALRSYVVASATALDAPSLMLPPRRPQRAESYAANTRISSMPGSSLLSLALPLSDSVPDALDSEATSPQGTLMEVPPEPFGRRVTNRMRSAAEQAQRLANEVSEGTQPLPAFGRLDRNSANATELAALGALGGADHTLYQLRFAPSPLAAGGRGPTLLRITPGQQRILTEAADFLRTQQPRGDVTVTGLVVRLFRERETGSGEVVIQGVDDDTGVARRFRVELAASDYDKAVVAHQRGLQVSATGDLNVRGTRRSLRRLRVFSVDPGVEDD
jgi:hypothetical protein